MPKRDGKIARVSEMRLAAPPVSPVDALRRNLLYAMFGAVDEGDMSAIVKKQVEKAKAGDAKAARLIIDMVQSGGERATTTHMQQAIVMQPSKRDEFDFASISETRRQIVLMLSAVGPLQSVEIAERLHAPLLQIGGVLDHDWFERRPDGWNITELAKLEVIPKQPGRQSLIELRRQAAQLLSFSGPQRASVIAESLAVEEVADLLNSDWFSKESGCWHLTDSGREEVSAMNAK